MIKVSKYKQGSVWYLRYSKEVGLPRRSTGTKDKKLAEEIRRTEEYRLIFGHHHERPALSITFSAFVQQFLNYKAGQGRARATVEASRYALNNFGKYLRKDLALNTITVDMIEGFAAHRRSIKKSENTIRNELIVLTTAFKWAKRQRFITENPCDLVDLPRRPKTPSSLSD